MAIPQMAEHMIVAVRLVSREVGDEWELAHWAFEQDLLLDFRAAAAIGVVKACVEELTGVPRARQCLHFAGMVLDEARTLWSYRLRDGAVIEVAQAASEGPQQAPEPNRLDS